MGCWRCDQWPSIQHEDLIAVALCDIENDWEEVCDEDDEDIEEDEDEDDDYDVGDDDDDGECWWW